MQHTEKEKKINLIYNIFSPSAPIDRFEFFIGRNRQLTAVRDTIEERGQHAVMYGGRGVGKTSIGNVLPALFQNLLITKVTCSRSDNFASIWDKVISKIQYVSSTKKIGFTAEEEKRMKNMSLPDREFIDANDILEVFNDIPSYSLVVIDEFDSIEDKETKEMMADTIKTLSDNNPVVTVLIIGISNSVDELIGKHPSLERCMKQIEVPLMTLQESAELISRSMKILELQIEEKVAEKIIDYSSGFPHYIHLLCKYAAMYAVEEDETMIKSKHFDYAVSESIKNSSYSLREAYKKAVASATEQNQFEDVIFASIMADEAGNKKFSPEDVLKNYNKITNQKLKKESIYYNLGMLCKPERGVILKKTGKSKNRKYEFQNPLMKAFVKLKLHQTK